MVISHFVQLSAELLDSVFVRHSLATLINYASDERPYGCLARPEEDPHFSKDVLFAIAGRRICQKADAKIKLALRCLPKQILKYLPTCFCPSCIKQESVSTQGCFTGNMSIVCEPILGKPQELSNCLDTKLERFVTPQDAAQPE